LESNAGVPAAFWQGEFVEGAAEVFSCEAGDQAEKLSGARKRARAADDPRDKVVREPDRRHDNDRCPIADKFGQ
jgi:hypothetical protein